MSFFQADLRSHKIQRLTNDFPMHLFASTSTDSGTLISTPVTPRVGPTSTVTHMTERNSVFDNNNYGMGGSSPASSFGENGNSDFENNFSIYRLKV